MATRTVTGTIKNHSEAAVAGVEVSFLPIGDTYDSEGHYTGTHITDTTDVAGEISVSLHTGQRYEVSTVGGIQFNITVPAGDGDLTLEGLRAAEEAATTEVNAVQTAIDAALALLELDDLIDVLITEQPDDGMVLTYDLGSNQWVPLAGGGGSVAWGDVTGTPTTLAGYGITDAAAAVHTHDDRYYTEAEVTSLIANFVTQAQGDVRYGQLGAANTWALAQTFTVPILASAGSASLPSFAFAGDPDTGFFNTTNQLWAATAGAARMGLSNASLSIFQPFFATTTDAATSSTTVVERHEHNSSGTPTAGFGSQMLWRLESSTTNDQSAATIDVLWNTATHASRKADMVFSAYDTDAREFLRGRGNGSAAAISFLGGTPQARQTITGSRGGNAALASLLTALAAFGLITDSTS